MAEKYLIVATPDELDLPFSKVLLDYGYTPVITGVGGANVIAAIKDLPRTSEVFNIGYAGSLCYPVGSAHFISDCRLWHPNVTFHEKTYHINDVEIIPRLCLTSGDFLLDGERLPDNSVVDMELAYICAFNFARTTSVKYVSDNLNLKQYYERSQPHPDE